MYPSGPQSQCCLIVVRIAQPHPPPPARPDLMLSDAIRIAYPLAVLFDPLLNLTHILVTNWSCVFVLLFQYTPFHSVPLRSTPFHSVPLRPYQSPAPPPPGFFLLISGDRFSTVCLSQPSISCSVIVLYDEHFMSSLALPPPTPPYPPIDSCL